MQYIFIHGLGQDSSSWDKAISYLPESSQLLCPDLWALLNDSEYTYANLYRVFKDYCNSISDPLNLCGLSLGAIIALNYAIEHPEKVQSLVLIGAQYKMPKRLLRFQNFIFRFMPKASFVQMGVQKKDVIKLTSSMVALDYSMELKNITCNTLSICGANDDANKKEALIISETVPNAQFHLIESAGHEVNIEAPKELASVLTDFWELDK